MNQSRTYNPDHADVFLIGHYGHWASNVNIDFDAYVTVLLGRLHDKSKPHLFLCPSWNPARSRSAGIAKVMTKFSEEGVNIYSVGIERNGHWQSTTPDRILPIPYLVKQSKPLPAIHNLAQKHRISNTVFYAGDSRPNAKRWAGCDRSMITPLIGAPNMQVSLFGKENPGRLNQTQYNLFMETIEFCLIICGDTPTSRSLASSIVHGCIPIRIGSRLRGLCEPPCKKGFGWTPSGKDNPHLPFMERMNWTDFPEVDEADFIVDPMATLQDLFVRLSTSFGKAVEYTWMSFLKLLDDSEHHE
eukprot:CAMPEP_0202476644 /NCGR_PEP_ID=MMETSP1360-20130828/93528_1 /ASSEMBLY_ACC=CAM_ASM_000848 /TAXON_ID=515479 /ORGANISM="Licmophora paradoxa, Strain CCMP2313" /LENGTH=300 /DNA_ID=CAMNT_0049103857 /DNA_START=81 /DNA_END=983 /DNA_ORIENTATION=+